MSENLIEKYNLPLKETVLASESGMNGVLLQEVLPDFFICPKGSKKISVKGLLRQNVKNGDLYSAVLNHLQNKPYVNISFAKGALNRFYREYMLLRENGMDCMFRAAQKNEIRLLFREKLGKDVFDFGGLAFFEGRNNTLNFICSRYIDDKDDDDLFKMLPGIEDGQNCFAHELGHMLMSADFLNKKADYDVSLSSNFGVAWRYLLLFEAYEASPVFDMARLQYECIEGKKHWTDFPYPKCISFMYKAISESYGAMYEKFGTSELFAYTMGIAGANKMGLSYWNNGHIHRMALETILDLGELGASSASKSHDITKNTIKDFKFSSNLERKLQAVSSFSNAVEDHEIFPDIHCLQEYDRRLNEAEELFCQENEQMRAKIKENLKVCKESRELLGVQEKNNKYVRSILKAHSDFSKKAASEEKQYS